MEMQRYHPLATLQEAANLYNRYQAGAGFRVLRAEMGKFPPVPWLFATLFLFLLLLMPRRSRRRSRRSWWRCTPRR